MLIMKKTFYRIVNYFLNKQWVLHIVMRFLSEENKEKIAIESIRQNFMFFRDDCTGKTDDEIKEGIKNLAKTIGSFGVTTEEAAKVLRVLGYCE